MNSAQMRGIRRLYYAIKDSQDRRLTMEKVVFYLALVICALTILTIALGASN